MYVKSHKEATSSSLNSISWSYFEFKKLQDSIKIRTQRLQVYWQKIHPCFFASIVYNIGFLLDCYHLNLLKVIYSW